MERGCFRRRSRALTARGSVGLVAAVAAASTALAAGVGAAATAPRVTVSADIAYRGAGGPVLDVVRSDTGVPRPAIVLVHGGTWSGGDRSYLHAQAVHLATLGFTAVEVDYRTSATRPVAAEAADVEAAVRWVLGHAAQAGVDPARVALLGESAGGNLALLAAGAVRGLAAVVTWSAPTDMVALSRGPGVPGWLASAPRAHLGCDVASCPQAWVAASPALRPASGLPPLLLVGSLDESVPTAQAQAMAVHVAAAGGQARVLLLPGTRHAVGYAADAWEASLTFLESALGPAPRPLGDVGALTRAATASLVVLLLLGGVGGIGMRLARARPRPVAAPSLRHGATG